METYEQRKRLNTEKLVNAVRNNETNIDVNGIRCLAHAGLSKEAGYKLFREAEKMGLDVLCIDYMSIVIQMYFEN
jgi:hypothetical protein